MLDECFILKYGGGPLPTGEEDSDAGQGDAEKITPEC